MMHLIIPKEGFMDYRTMNRSVNYRYLTKLKDRLNINGDRILSK